MDETTIRTIRISYDFKIIPFDDSLWKLAFKNLRDKFNIEPITLLETKKWNTPFKRYFDVYVDKALIEDHGYGAVVEMVKEKIDYKMQTEMDVFFKDFFLKRRITMEDKKQYEAFMEELKKLANNFRDVVTELGDILAKILPDVEIPDEEEDTWEMEIPYEDGDEYYYIQSNGDIFPDVWYGTEADDRYFSQGNIFPTKEAAKLEAKRRNLLARFRAFRDECNGDWKPDWDNHLENKYYIGFGLKGFGVCSTALKKVFPIFGYFMFKKDAQRAIELFGDEIKELFVEGE